MIKFLLVCVLVFVVVDLFVRFIIDPWIRSSNQKDKAKESKVLKYNPSLRLATETMYDGGKPYDKDEIETAKKDENIANNKVE